MDHYLVLHPHAKVNLGLFITGKLPNGYHTLETLLYPIPSLHDELRIQASLSKNSSLSIQGIEIDGDLNDNLCMKAYRALKEEVGDLPPVDIHLTKHIPAGAGLGGGSSDAAFTLKGLNTFFELGLSEETLAKIATPLGADVPFFIYGKPMLATGIGTELTEIPLNFNGEIRLYTQPIHSSTVAAYKSLDYTMFDHSRKLLPVLQQDMSSWKEDLVNDLEVPVFEAYPSLQKVKEDLYAEGAVYAAMSGSGSCMFGIFQH
ncbi:MAG: 4-(cytidine 5'-diphospho)-2-C-methyl-D-erythritol kinase [Bacteroidota bacterium]